MGKHFSDTIPQPGDMDNVLLGKILQRLNGVAQPGDTDNDLLVRLLTQLNSADGGGSGAAQTPWTSNINGGGFTLTNVASVDGVTSTELGFLSGATSAVQTQLNARVLKAGDAMTGALSVTLAPAVNTATTGFLLADTTAASSGNQQYSPVLRFTGQGWKTNSTAGSQAVDFQLYAVPVQGAAAPTARLAFTTSINGGAFTEQIALGSDGRLLFGTNGAGPSLLVNGATLALLSQNATTYSCSFASKFFTSISTGSYGFSSSSADATVAVDIALMRNAAGVFEVTSGAANTYRDLALRTLKPDATITAGGTTGAQTINKASGTVNFAAAATTLVVTNSIVTASSIVFAVVRTGDATAAIKNVIPASGSFTITLSAAATAETSVGFLVINAA